MVQISKLPGAHYHQNIGNLKRLGLLVAGGMDFEITASRKKIQQSLESNDNSQEIILMKPACGQIALY